jgi:hypothetical protein
MGPKSLYTDLFTFKYEMTNYKLRDVESTLCLPQPRTNSLKKVSCLNLTEHIHIWTLYQPKLERATPSCPLKLKSLLIFLNSIIYSYTYIYFLLYVTIYYIFVILLLYTPLVEISLGWQRLACLNKSFYLYLSTCLSFQTFLQMFEKSLCGVWRYLRFWPS